MFTFGSPALVHRHLYRMVFCSDTGFPRLISTSLECPAGTSTVPEYLGEYLEEGVFTLGLSDNRSQAACSDTKCEHSFSFSGGFAPLGLRHRLGILFKLFYFLVRKKCPKRFIQAWFDDMRDAEHSAGGIWNDTSLAGRLQEYRSQTSH